MATIFHTGKCPKCEQQVASVKLENVDVREGLETRWHGVSYLCPHCSTVLSVAIDPIVLKADIINAIAKQLKR